MQHPTGIEDLDIGLTELEDSLQEYEDAEDYYEGRSPNVWLDPAILSALGGIPYKINFARVPINVIKHRMAIASVMVLNENEISNQLNEIWSQNEMEIEEESYTTNALKLGDYYIEVWPDKNGDPKITACSPAVMRIIYDPEDDRTPLFACKRWTTGFDVDNSGARIRVIRANLIYSDRIEKYRSNDKGRTWEKFYAEGEDWPLINEYGELPVFHLRTDRPYGEPVHREAYGPADAITKIAQAHLGTTDFLGMPQRVALVDPNDPRGTGSLNDFDNSNPGNVNSESLTRVDGDSGAAGTLWAIRAKAVTEFKPAESTHFIESMKFYIGVAAQLTETPLRFFADPTGQHPSGLSLKTADAPLKNKVSRFCMSFAATWTKALSFALRIDRGELDPKIKYPIIIKWTPAEISDAKDDWEAAVEKIRAGVPQRQVFLDMGYTEEQCDSWGLKEQEARAMVPQVFSGAAQVVAAAEVLEDKNLPNPAGIDPNENKGQIPPVPPGGIPPKQGNVGPGGNPIVTKPLPTNPTVPKAANNKVNT